MSASRQESWAVVGGGMLGLTVALRLAQRGRAVTLFEASGQLGGRWGSAAFTLPQAQGPGPKALTWTKSPYAIMAADRQAIALLRELGLGDTLSWAPAATMLRDGTASFPLDHAFDLARLPFLGLTDRTRLAMGLFFASHRDDVQRLERLSIDDWLNRINGPRARVRFWHPILRAKLGDGYGRASAALLWRQLARQRSSRAFAGGQGTIAQVAGTAGAVIDRFERTLAALGVTFRKAASVQSIKRVERGLVVETAHRRDIFDNVVTTVACGDVAALAHDLSEAEREGYRRIAYQARIMPMLVLRRPLVAAAETFFTDDTVSFPLIVNGTTPGGNGDMGHHGLVYMPRILPQSDPMARQSDATLRTRAVSQLRQAFPEIAETDILGFRVDRIADAMPLPEPGYADRLPRMVTTVPGLHIVNAAHVVHGALDLEGVIALANRAIAVLLPHEVETAIQPVAVRTETEPPSRRGLQDAAE